MDADDPRDELTWLEKVAALFGYCVIRLMRWIDRGPRA
jgi:hypothetical protein